MREAAQNSETEVQPEEGAAPSRLMPLLVLAVAFLLGTGGGALLLGPRFFDQRAAAAETREKKGGKHGDQPDPQVTIENLVVNPANSGGTRFLLITLAFRPDDEEAAIAMRAAEPQLRDIFVTLLGKRSIAELSDLAVRDSIRAELLHAADSITPGAGTLYIPQFVLQ